MKEDICFVCANQYWQGYLVEWSNNRSIKRSIPACEILDGVTLCDQHREETIILIKKARGINVTKQSMATST